MGSPSGIDRILLSLAGSVSATPDWRQSGLAEEADTAAFVASDQAGAITGAVVNLTCGPIVD
jgi:enoyl-[acyl-carrier-protein] reductase (NADH)